MAKSKAQAKAQQVARPRRGSRQEAAEHWTRLLVLGGVIAVILIAGILIAFGWYQTHVKPLNKTVLQVGSQEYSLSAVERRMKSTLKDNPTLRQSQSVLQLPDITVLTLEREAKLLQAAGQLNLSVSPEDLAAEIRKRGSLADDVQADVYAAEFRSQVEKSGLHAGEFEDMVRASLLETKVADYFTFVAPDEEPQVRGNYIYFDDATKAQQAVQRINAGEDFTAVASELSPSAASGQPVIVLDWTPKADVSLIPTAVQGFLFGAQPNQVSDVLNGGRGTYFVAQLLERDERRALDANGKKRVGDREMQKWLDGLNATLKIKNNLSQSDSNRALNDVL